MDEEKRNNIILDKIINFIFSNDERKWLILIVLLGAILRFIVLSNVSPLADEMVYGTHPINIINSGVINEQNECPVWFYLTDIAYKTLGVNAFAGRFLSFFFGILTILIVYLIGKKIFGRKAALIAAFLLSISAYHISNTLMEMDEAMIFFVLFSFYLFIKNLKDKNQLSYLSVILIAIAVLIKPIALTFALPFLLYFLFFIYKQPVEKRKEFLNKNYKRIILSAILFILFMMPILAYNIILYKQKGITDIQFARFFKVNPEIFAGLGGYNLSFSITVLFSQGLFTAFKYFFLFQDPAIFLLSIGGIFVIFLNKKYKPGRTIVLMHLIPFIFLAGTALLETHFVSFIPLLSLSAAAFISFASEILKEKKNQKILIYGILALVFLVNLCLLMPHMTSKSAIFKMRNYAVQNLHEKDIIVADARIYRGRIAWMFNDKPYIESSLFPQIFSTNQNLSGQPISSTVYFVECVPDDCGWGTIKDQPEFNQSTEQFFDYIKNNSIKEKIFLGGGGYDAQKDYPYFIVYKTTINIHPQIYSYIYQTHDWFYYPVRWAKNDWYDKYYPEGTLQFLLNSAGKLFLWIAILLALLSPILLIRELIKEVQ